MIKKFLKDVVFLIVGKQAEGIVDIIDTSKHVNEFIIAKKLDITINQTRNILYKLSDYGLVSSIRKKDKKKGWYTYFWKFEISKSLEFLKAELDKKILQLNSQIKSRETKQFYVCEKCNIDFNEENALLHNFTCPECGDVLTLKDNVKVLKEFKRNLEKIEREKLMVEQVLLEENKKTEKIKLKELKKIENEKMKERAKKQELRRNLKKKELKKLKGKNKMVKKKLKKSINKKSIKKKLVKKKSIKKKRV